MSNPYQYIYPYVKAFEEAITHPIKVRTCGCDLIITDIHHNVFTIFLDCGEPDYLSHIVTDVGKKLDFFDADEWPEEVRALMTNNLVSYHQERLVELKDSCCDGGGA